MRTAETVLGIIYERGTQGLPLEDIYRQLYNPDLYLRAYARLYANKGAMTTGTTSETVDAMSLKKICKLIEDLRQEKFRWTPVRRGYIPKKNGKKRPLGMPTWTDKLLQEVVRLILETYYEPQFRQSSHGFRPERGCHSALSDIRQHWTGTKWFVEGDIRGCFDNIDHEVLMAILAGKLHDQRFLRLIHALLKAGYVEEWTYHHTLSGTPQGSVVSPVLSNIYLDQLDTYIEEELLPKYNRKQGRADNAHYTALIRRAWYLRSQGRKKEASVLRKQAQQLPSQDPDDPDYRRLRYIRYADDFLLGFAGPKAEAQALKEEITQFLRDRLKVELSQEKTLITHATTQKARFLGYEIAAQYPNHKQTKKKRSVNGTIGLFLPADVVETYCKKYQQRGKAKSRVELTRDDDFTLISRYQAEYRGVMQYYVLATNIAWLAKLHYVMQTSLLKTLAHKHKSSVAKMVNKYRSEVQTPFGKMKCLEITVERKGKKPLIARFGGIPWRRQDKAILLDLNPTMVWVKERNELVKRLLANTCELCGARENIVVHHIRKLADLNKEGRKKKPLWVHVMAARRRKTLVVCHECHVKIHAGKADGGAWHVE